MRFLNLPYLHIPNRAFRGTRASKLKDFPDYLFAAFGGVYMVEFGTPGAHLDRKERQVSVMENWKNHGGIKYAVITTREELVCQMKVWNLNGMS